MDGGFFRCRAIATGDDGAQVDIRVFSSGDPGNRVTVTALCESALSLAQDDLSNTRWQGGVLTPMTGFENSLVERLKRAGWEMSVHPLESKGAKRV